MDWVSIIGAIGEGAADTDPQSESFLKICKVRQCGICRKGAHTTNPDKHLAGLAAVNQPFSIDDSGRNAVETSVLCLFTHLVDLGLEFV